MPFAIIKTEKPILVWEEDKTVLDMIPDRAVIQKNCQTLEDAKKWRDQQREKDKLLIIEYW